MEMTTLGCAPCSYDTPTGSRPREDLTLKTMERGLARYQARPSRSDYVNREGDVCAAGAIFADDPSIGDRLEDRFYGAEHFREMIVDAEAPAKEAFELVNAAAGELYPAYADNMSAGCTWSGPLEAINQDDGMTWDDRQDMVVDCYQTAIRRRKEKS